MTRIDTIRELEIVLSDWVRYQSISKPRFISDRDCQNMILHAMFLAIQTAIDAGAELIASSKIPKRPESYRETFEILGEHGILTPEHSGSLGELASFRNVLIHLYSKLDLEEVYHVLQEDNKPLEEFLDVLIQLKSSPPNPR